MRPKPHVRIGYSGRPTLTGLDRADAAMPGKIILFVLFECLGYEFV